MKKLLTIILILALAVPALALAEETDPIVGAWYVIFNYKELPPQPAIEEKDYVVNVFVFEPSGALTFFALDAKKDNTREAYADISGKWTKKDDKYTYSGIGIGNNLGLELDGDIIKVQITDNIWYVMHRMEWDSFYDTMIYR
ncbi:MAG: hypothetical protein J6S50_03105 [Oscillospiraceae bacterium]|nr:hypothetical protein [Lachnospiraceae bacterium]MBO7727493.1 hypothetical protein [Oscillospiraceae bacterium]